MKLIFNKYQNLSNCADLIYIQIVLFHFQFTEDPVVIIHVSRIHVVYDAEEHIVRYASANMATSRDSNIRTASSDTDNQLSETNQQHHYNQKYYQQNENVENQRSPCTNCEQVIYIYSLHFFSY